MFFHPEDNRMIRYAFFVILFSPHHLIGCPKKNSTKNIFEKLELVEKFDTSKYENHTHYYCGQDSPFENFLSIIFLCLHTDKYHQKDKEIVDRERFFYEIGSQEFNRKCMIVRWVVEKKYRYIEEKCRRNPYYTPINIRFHTPFSSAGFYEKKVYR
jgi:hypothetical protein